MGLDLFGARGRSASTPVALDANAFADSRTREARRTRCGDFDAAVDEAVSRRPRRQDVGPSAGLRHRDPVVPATASTDDDQAQAARRTPPDPDASGADSVGTAPCPGAAGAAEARENVVLDADAAGEAVGATAPPGTAPASVDTGVDAASLSSAGAVPTGSASGNGAPSQLAAAGTTAIAEGAAPTPVATTEGAPEPTALEARAGARVTEAGESTERAEQDPSSRGEAIRLISAALRQAPGQATDTSLPGAPVEGVDGGADGAAPARGWRPPGGADAFGHPLSQAMEAALQMTEAPGRAEAAWRRAAEAAFDQMPEPGSPEERTPTAASLVTGPSHAGTAAPPTGAAEARLSPAVDVEVGEQIVQGIRLQWRNGTGEARLRLQPDHLGALEVSLQVSGGAVRAVVRAESEAVQEWIARNRDDLKAALEAQGLKLEELEVVVDPDDRRRRQQGEAEPPTLQRAATTAPGGHAFEVRV